MNESRPANDASVIESGPDRLDRVPWRRAAQTVVGFWLAYFVLNTLRAAIEGAEDQVGMALRRTVVTLIGMALTALLCLVLRQVERRSNRLLVATAFIGAIPVAIAYATINFVAFYVVSPLDSVRREIEQHPDKLNGGWVTVIADGAASWYFFIAAWAVLYVALAYACKGRQAERSAALYRAEAQAAQLRALRYQINPHFLFNTLNSLSTLVLRQRNDEAERMILNLSRFYRTSLTVDPAEDVALAEEIRMQRLYLDIEQVRFPGRLKVVVDVPAALETASVPGLILQPIVENAIKYAVAPSAGLVTLTIRARQEGDRVTVAVSDDGAASPGDHGGGHGVGLRNVCDRLKTRFHDRATCDYGHMPEGGFRVRLTMPLLRDG